MSIEHTAAGLWKSMRVLAFGSALVMGLQACKRPHATGLQDAAGHAAPEDAEAAAVEPTEEVESFLEPLTGAPWLGHSDDGVLVKVEFFAEVDSASTLCRTSVESSFSGTASNSSSFAASSDLSNIIWDDGKSDARYDPEMKVLEAKVTSKLGTHQAKLRQLNTTEHPELATFRKSIPDDEDSQSVHQKFSERLANGARWWKSVDDGWDKLVTPQELVAGGAKGVLIRPAGKVPIKIPALKPGDGFDIPIICHLPPGTTLAAADQTVGVVAELQHDDSVRSMWVLASLNPGAITQDVQAHWAGGKDEPALGGTATLYVYLCKSSNTDGAQAATPSQPVSNLLKIDLEIAAD